METMDVSQYISKEKLEFFQKGVIDWGRHHLREFPWRQTVDPYPVLVAELLLQQTDAPRVVPIYQKLIENYPSLNALSNASLEEIADILKPLGLHYRAARLYGIASAIANNPIHKGKIPDDEKTLLGFKGVGRYIAKSVCANAFGQPVTILDTNISRIIQRFFGVLPHRKRARDDPFFWRITKEIAPLTNIGQWNLTLIDFGASICTHRNPQCAVCPLQEKCNYVYQVNKRL